MLRGSLDNGCIVIPDQLSEEPRGGWRDIRMKNMLTVQSETLGNPSCSACYLVAVVQSILIATQVTSLRYHLSRIYIPIVAQPDVNKLTDVTSS